MALSIDTNVNVSSLTSQSNFAETRLATETTPANPPSTSSLDNTARQQYNSDKLAASRRVQDARTNQQQAVQNKRQAEIQEQRAQERLDNAKAEEAKARENVRRARTEQQKVARQRINVVV